MATLGLQIIFESMREIIVEVEKYQVDDFD
jgi:hypothetical protein